METESLVQPRRYFTASEIAGELVGVLEVLGPPEITTGYADIYHGILKTPGGEHVDVAIKEFKAIIPRNRSTDLEALRRRTDTRIKREMIIWSQTAHRNLHPLLGYLSQPQPRLISPWCRHGNLTDYLQANPDLTRLDKLQLIYQAATGLNHLHSLIPPICHADIKPENVLINDELEAALSDFGLSRVLLGLEESSGLTTTGVVRGTLRYMAGELHLDETLRPNLETDVFAFGGLILTVMSGKPPFSGLRDSIVLLRIIEDQLPKPEEHLDLPRGDHLWNLIRRCWDKNPGARPTMREVLWEIWGEIPCEESGQRSTLCPPPAVEPSGSQHPYMDLDTRAKRSQETIRTHHTRYFLPGSTSHLSSGVPEADWTLNATAEVLPAARRILGSLEVKSKVIPVIGKYITAAADVGLMLVGIVQVIDRNQNIGNSLSSNVWDLAVSLDQLQEQSSQQRQGGIRACITDIQREFQTLQQKLKELYSSGLFPNVLSCCDHPEGLKEWEAAAWKAWETMQTLVSLDPTRLTVELESKELQEKHRRILDRLGDGKYGAQGNAIEDVICFPGTRVNILVRIDNWIRDSSNSERVLWIRGMAGQGKSTIASTVAHNWKHRASCAIFHFRRGQNTLNARFVCALAKQLGNSLVPEVRNAMLESVRENEDIADQRLDEQFKTLFVAPLVKVQHVPHITLIVLDALDECDTTKDAVDFVKLIDRYSPSFPSGVKFLLTCRPEAPLLRILEPRQWNALDLSSATDVSSDLARFIKQACRQIREDHVLPADWPSSEDVGRLVEMSQGLFQWARTAISYINTGSPVDRLHSLVERPSVWGELDNLYHQILSRAFDSGRIDPERQELLCQMLGTLVVAPHPVSLDVFATLHNDSPIVTGMDRQSIIGFLRREVLADLNSLLFIPISTREPLRLIHTSIRDLLVNKGRCGSRRYWIDTVQHHERLAGLSLGLMLQHLKENICNLPDISKANSEIQDVIGHYVSKTIGYCCLAWSTHLTEGGQWLKLGSEAACVRLAEFELFSKKKILFWLEVMSLVGAIPEAMAMAKNVYRWLSRDLNEECNHGSLVTLWDDIQRFIVAFSEPISFGAIHIYVSALPHCPLKTQFWECYHSHAKLRTVLGLQPLSWPSNFWTRYISEGASPVTFSPNGETIASGSEDGTIRLWDAQTGTPSGQPLTSHSSSVQSIAFSPDGKIIASGYEDGTIRLWDVENRTPWGQPLNGHRNWVRSVTFSPNGRVLASGSYDMTIRMWDGRTGTPLGQPLTGHRGWVQSVAFSPDGKILASGSSEKIIRLWEAQTGAPLDQPLTGHVNGIRSLAFSPDGKVLASGSDDMTIRLWNTETGTSWGRPLTGHSNWVQSVTFSFDGKVLASGSYDGTIRLWDVRTGISLGQPLVGHSGSVQSVAFSPDSRVLASGSSDKTIRLWDSRTETLFNGSSVSQRDLVTFAVFSPDGKILASGSSENTIRFWDVHTGAPLGQPLTGHRGWVQSAAFSPDGKVLASGSYDMTIRLWDVRTRTPLGQPLTGHGTCVQFVAFSPDGKILGSRSDDRMIRLWDTSTWAPSAPPSTAWHRNRVSLLMFSQNSRALVCKYEDGTVESWDGRTGIPSCQPLKTDNAGKLVAFSPDGKILAFAVKSPAFAIRLRDGQNGIPLGLPLTGHSNFVSSVAFSPDGTILASGSADRTIRLWDGRTGMPLVQPLTGHGNSVRPIVFSPDGTILASGSYDRTIRLWDGRTGMPLGQPLIGHGDGVSSIVFSPDGTILASGSADRTIRLWDGRSGIPLGRPLTGHSKTVLSVTFSLDGRILTSGSDDRTIRLWEGRSGIPLGQPLIGHSEKVHSVTFSLDGRILASGSTDGTIRLWDTRNVAPLGLPFVGPSGGIFSIAISPDGKVLASTCSHDTTSLWDYTVLAACVDRGRHNSRSALTLGNCEPPCSVTCPVKLRVENHWVTYASSRIFWLPPQYWVDEDYEVLLSKGTIAIRCHSFLAVFDISGVLAV